jgi:hypothetical protein
LYWFAEIIVTRTGAATQTVHFRGNANGSAVYNQWVAATETLSGDVVIKCVGSATADNDIVQKSLVVEYLPYVGVVGVPAHDLTGAAHTDSGLTAGHVLTALTATSFGWQAATGGGGAISYRFAIADPPAGDEIYPFMVVPAGQITKVSCILVGSGSADANVELEGADILGTDLTVGTVWSDSGALTEATAANDEIGISLKNVVSPVGYLVVQIDFEAS